MTVSTELTLVAQWHVQDSIHANEVTGDYGTDTSCNLHTWYGGPDAPYTTCCYTSDHAQASCMWNKPGEISGGAYTATGYENAAAGYSSPAAALEGWSNSPGHNDVILNQDNWETHPWQAMGVGVDTSPGRRFYFLWFAEQQDPAGAPEACPEPGTAPLTACALLSLALLRARSHPGCRRR